MPYKDPEKAKEVAKKYYLKNRERLLKKGRLYRELNYEKERARCKSYAHSHQEERSLYKKLHRERINEGARRVYRTKIKTNPQYQIGKNIHTRLYVAIKNNYIKSDIHNLGCNLKEFKNYIESKFKIGMTWDNYGKEWHIDHIKPLNSFDLTNKEQLLTCCHFTNTQPLWEQENLRKWTKVI